jgi:hypothetical protein
MMMQSVNFAKGRKDLSKWLPTRGNVLFTLLVVTTLLLTQHLWARPFQSPLNAPGASATTVNYQGRLANSDGTPLTQQGVALEFAIYDAATDGALIWPASGTETHIVDVNEGLFSVGLGSKTTGGIPTTTWNGDRYLEITVGGETLAPRELIRSVPIAGIALTVPDGSVPSEKLNLDYGTACLPNDAQVALPGSYETVDIPGITLNFSVDQPSKVLFWMHGLAWFDQPSSRQVVVRLRVDDQLGANVYSKQDNIPFNLDSMRALDIESGSHTISVQAKSYHAGTLHTNKYSSSYLCVNYLVLGSQ